MEVAFNPLNAKLNPTCHLLALLGAYHILHISRIRVKIMVLSDAAQFSVLVGTVISEGRAATIFRTEKFT